MNIRLKANFGNFTAYLAPIVLF